MQRHRYADVHKTVHQQTPQPRVANPFLSVCNELPTRTIRLFRGSKATHSLSLADGFYVFQHLYSAETPYRPVRNVPWIPFLLHPTYPRSRIHAYFYAGKSSYDSRWNEIFGRQQSDSPESVWKRFRSPYHVLRTEGGHLPPAIRLFLLCRFCSLPAIPHRGRESLRSK